MLSGTNTLWANWRLSPGAGSKLGQRRRRWTNYDPALGECLALAGTVSWTEINSGTSIFGSNSLATSKTYQDIRTVIMKNTFFSEFTSRRTYIPLKLTFHIDKKYHEM